MSTPRRKFSIPLVIVVAGWGLSWLFARDIVKGLESVGALPRRGLILNDASDFAFSLLALSVLLAVWAIWRVFATIGQRLVEPVAVLAEQDPRYVELTRRKEVLLRELKELEFDRQLRKISDEDYESIERRLRTQATALLRSLDELDPVRLYGERIRADLKNYAADEPPANLKRAAAASMAGSWRDEVLARPLYRELVPVLGERDLLLAALRELWVVSAEIDRADAAESVLTVEDGRKGERFVTTLRGLRERVLAALREGEGDDGETLRLAALAGLPAEKASSDLRARVLASLSRDLGLGAAA